MYKRKGGTDGQASVEMARYIATVALLVLLGELLVSGCLITNCPKGGKRNGKFGLAESNIKPVSKNIILSFFLCVHLVLIKRLRQTKSNISTEMVGIVLESQ